jgi:hypothetical protein
MSVALCEIDRGRKQRELRQYTDLELIVSGRNLRKLIANAKMVVSLDGDRGERWEAQLVDAIAEWRSRQAGRRAGNLCLCHLPGDQAITGTAQTWRSSGYDRWLSGRITNHPPKAKVENSR